MLLSIEVRAAVLCQFLSYFFNKHFDFFFPFLSYFGVRLFPHKNALRPEVHLICIRIDSASEAVAFAQTPR